MEFLPWKTVDLDGAFRVTAPESIAEEVIQEVSNAVTFRFPGDLSAVRLEILLTLHGAGRIVFLRQNRNHRLPVFSAD